MAAERGLLAVAKPWQADTGVNASGCGRQAVNRADGQHTPGLERCPKATKNLEKARVQLLHMESIDVTHSRAKAGRDPKFGGRSSNHHNRLHRHDRTTQQELTTADAFLFPVSFPVHPRPCYHTHK